MGSQTQRYCLDTWVNATAPTRTYEESTTLQVKSGERLAFVYFQRPFPLGASIVSATLRLRMYADSGTGSRSVTVRRTAARPVYSRLTWATEPGGLTGPGEPKTATKTAPWGGAEEWAFDVTSHMQSVADGADWTGWRVETDSATTLVIYGNDGHTDNRPSLEIVWSDAPDAPTQLVPSGGRELKTAKPLLRWDYTDVSGDTTMAGLQVQVTQLESGFATPLFDTGQIAASRPELDLSTAMSNATPAAPYGGIPAGGSHWWRVRVQDGAGIWSKWSDAAEMGYTAPATFALVSPAPGGTVAAPSSLDDATPVISWSLTGATQSAYRVRVWLNVAPKTPLWDSGRVTSAVNSVSLPKGVLRWDDRNYRVRVDAWDTLDRQSVPGFTSAYTSETIAFLDWDAATVGTTTLSARALDPYPFVELEWTRSPAPDGWTIVRNGEIVADVEYAETLQGDGTNRWVDRYAPPLTELRYVVRPKVNGKTAFGNPTALVYCQPVGQWLVNDTDEVCLIGVDDGSWAMGETSVIHEPISGDRVVQVRTGMRGYEGSISGTLIGDCMPGLSGISARQWRDRLLRIKRDGGAHLIVSTLSIPVYTSEVVAAPSPLIEENYTASFSFWQRGRFDWDAL